MIALAALAGGEVVFDGDRMAGRIDQCGNRGLGQGTPPQIGMDDRASQVEYAAQRGQGLGIDLLRDQAHQLLASYAGMIIGRGQRFADTGKRALYGTFDEASAMGIDRGVEFRMVQQCVH